MRLEHKLQWRCAARIHSKPITFARRGDFQNHMRQSHAGTFTEAQLDLITEGSARPIGSTFTYCPICDSDKVSDTEQAADANPSRMEKHVIDHLVLAALRSLPWPEDERELASSARTGKPEARSTIQGDLSHETHCSFEDVPDMSLQRPEDDSMLYIDDQAVIEVVGSLRYHEWGFMPQLLPPYAGPEYDRVVRPFRKITRELQGTNFTFLNRVLWVAELTVG